ncbi:glycosyltransferase family A protein [Cuniculiplasma divulgatum]|uniref:Glycosyltransferase n=1 Tax=Cuniculiplasma divulgatum TaxID=1673428 RepID=A0A1N5UJ68_9ARCH|nr:glycosyltransferase family A protein [Cuniculiplasma divulgatum]SIM60751.1 glycosyltransferase [Cuniculiplasma divulgatum]SJK84837.1 glycosyltransferase [Cuniculiplasma divulgatum]
MISIELISKGEQSLIEVLESIKNQSYRDYEIICANSSNNINIKKMLLEYNCKVIDLPTNSLALFARYIAHKCANGDRSLLLDSTRPLRNNALELLYKNYYNHDMVILREDSLGKGFWVNQAKMLRYISELQLSRLNKESLAFLLPRFYSSKLLSEAFNAIIKNSGKLFDQISYGEHHIIFDECKKLSDKLEVTSEILLSHYEDSSLKKIIRKYYWYGKSQRTLRGLSGSAASKLSTHHRRNVKFSMRLKTIPINSARSIPFILGYIFGRDKDK